MKKIIIGGLIICFGILLIIFYNIPCEQFTDYVPDKSKYPDNNTSDQTDVEIADPSAAYCGGLGYQYQKDGSCLFDDGVKCESWSFFRGECGQEYTFCEKNGGKIVVTDEGCSVTQKCALCILKDGRECIEWDYFKGRCQ